MLDLPISSLVYLLYTMPPKCLVWSNHGIKLHVIIRKMSVRFKSDLLTDFIFKMHFYSISCIDHVNENNFNLILISIAFVWCRRVN